MAKNWTMSEAVRAIRENDKEGVLDLGRRFPLTAVILAQLNEAGVALCDALPEYVTARKVEAVLKGDVVESDEDVVGDVVEKPAKASKKNEDATQPKSWKGMNQYQKKKARELGEAYVAACKAFDKAAAEEGDEIPAPKKAAKKVKKAAPVEDDDFDEEDEKDEEDEVKPFKKAAKKGMRNEKKPAKKVEFDEDEDDDFDDFDFDDDDDE